MIEFAKDEDREEIISLWQSCFGDERSYVLFFLESAPVYRCAVIRRDKKIVSMLFLLKGSIKGGVEEKSAFYIYAACTLPEYRGAGLMGELIENCAGYAKGEGFDFLTLTPASDSLFNYYSRFNFVNAFWRKTAYITRENLCVNSQTKLEFTYPDALEFCSLRTEFLKNSNAFLWPPDMNLYAIKEHQKTKGRLLEVKGGGSNALIMYHENTEKIIINEILSKDLLISNVIFELFKQSGMKGIYLKTNLEYNNIDIELKSSPSSMARALNLCAEEFLKQNGEFYFGLTLE